MKALNPTQMKSGRFGGMLTFLMLASLLNARMVAEAAEVAAVISQRETSVGLPVTMQIRVSNASSPEAPQIPSIDGLTIESLGSPSRSTKISIVNGRRSENSSVTYAYRVTANREGSFTIPPISIEADGRDLQTQAIRIVATKGETNDLMFVEIEGKQDSIYVGQPLELTLKIWLRPFRDRGRDITLSEGDMWQSIDDSTNWGPFADRIEEMNSANQRPGGHEVLRPDSGGNQRSYYVYEIDATVYPQRPGMIDGDDVRIVVRYPTELGRARDPFESFFGGSSPFRSRLFGDDFMGSPFPSRLSITAVKPMVAEATVEPIRVKPVPEQGRPADYRGAVGNYRIVTEARPTRVSAGDPITLHIGIDGDGPMDLVQAPPLAELAELTKDFRVPNEPLAGFVDGSQKVFTTSIRPRSENVQTIPPIPFSYFDPQAEEFVTVYSEPITVEVAPADKLALDAIVEGSGRRGRDGDMPSGDEATVSLELYPPSEVLNQERPVEPWNVAALAWLAVPPLAFFFLASLRLWSPLGARLSLLKSPYKRLQTQLEGVDSLAEIESALSTYLRMRLRKQSHGDTVAAAIGALRTAGHRDLAIQFERLLSQAGEFTTAVDDTKVAEVKQHALEASAELELRLRRRSSLPMIDYKGKRATPQAGLMLLALASSSLLSTATLAAASVQGLELSTRQCELLVDEAADLYRQSRELQDGNPADSKQLASQAAAKFQLVVDSGVSNSKLYFNLGNACLLSSDPARAIANFKRALRIDPTNRNARNRLAIAEQSLESDGSKPPSRGESLKRLPEVFSHYVHPLTMRHLAIAGWFAFWAVLTARLLSHSFPWKSLACLSLILCGVMGWSFWSIVASAERGGNAVVVVPSIQLRIGGGPQFETKANLESVAGRQVTVIERRSDWSNIRTADGETGWVSNEAIEVI